MTTPSTNPRICEANPLGLTQEVIIEGLVNEWEYLCHDDYEEGDATPEERRVELQAMTMEELLKEADRDGKEDWESFEKCYCH